MLHRLAVGAGLIPVVLAVGMIRPGWDCVMVKARLPTRLPA